MKRAIKVLFGSIATVVLIGMLGLVALDYWSKPEQVWGAWVDGCMKGCACAAITLAPSWDMERSNDRYQVCAQECSNAQREAWRTGEATDSILMLNPDITDEQREKL
jgi:hypothetical protein